MLDQGTSSPERNGLDKHVLSFYWDDFQPHLLFYDRAARKVDRLSLERLAVTVGEDRTCVGHFDDDRYVPCPKARKVGRITSCRECMAPWIPVQSCIFEPQCSGERCDHPEFCQRQHYVYLASFSNMIKVGMTSVGRLRERAIEQGADAVRPLFMCRDRKEARELEKETSRRFKIPQEVRAPRIAGTWTSPPSRSSIEHVQEHYVKKVGRWREPLNEELTFLDRYPVRELPRTAPRPVSTVGTHRGEVMGIKGRYMIFRDGRGTSRLLDLSDLPARNIRVLD